MNAFFQFIRLSVIIFIIGACQSTVDKSVVNENAPMQNNIEYEIVSVDSTSYDSLIHNEKRYTDINWYVPTEADEEKNEFQTLQQIAYQAGDIKFQKGVGFSNMSVDTLLDGYRNWLDKAASKNCKIEDSISLGLFNIDFDKKYENSSRNTNEYDGKSFCLRALNSDSKSIAYVIYTRSEGGHTTDVVSIESVGSNGLLYKLPLSLQSSWDGYTLTISSSIETDKMIYRKKIERFGWSNTHPDSLVKQPIKITDELFELTSKGVINLVSEQVEEKNIKK